jgi:hypothetical protein
MSLVAERYDPRPAAPVVRLWRALLTAATLGLFFAAHANWRHPVLRLDSQAANNFVFLVALALPWVALALAQPALRGRHRIAHFAALAPLLLYTLPAGTCAAGTTADAAGDGVDGSFAPIRTVSLGASRVRVYRTNCGAPCDFGLVVRHERPVLPGLLLVRDLAGWYHAADARLAPDRAAVRVTVTDTSRGYRGPSGPQRLAVRPWVYF